MTIRIQFLSIELSCLQFVADLEVSANILLRHTSWSSTGKVSKPNFSDDLSIFLDKLFVRLPARQRLCKTVKTIQSLWKVMQLYALENMEMDITCIIDKFTRQWRRSSLILERVSDVLNLKISDLEIIESTEFTAIISRAPFFKPPLYVGGDAHIATKNAVMIVKKPGVRPEDRRRFVDTKNHIMDCLKPSHLLKPLKSKRFDTRVFRAGEVSIKKENVKIEGAKGSSHGSVRIIGVFEPGFILISHEDGVLVVDQHAAHERIRLEAFIETMKPGGPTVPLTPDIKVEHPMLFSRWGFELTGDMISRIPFVLQEQLSCAPEAIQEMDSSSHGLGPIMLELLKSKACRGAIKFGDRLSLEQVNDLLNNLWNCKQPTICAHGRPSMRLLKLKPSLIHSQGH